MKSICSNYLCHIIKTNQAPVQNGKSYLLSSWPESKDIDSYKSLSRVGKKEIIVVNKKQREKRYEGKKVFPVLFPETRSVCRCLQYLYTLRQSVCNMDAAYGNGPLSQQLAHNVSGKPRGSTTTSLDQGKSQNQKSVERLYGFIGWE
jgi:hypothetical protein